MEKAKLDVLKGMSREARSEYFQKNKSDFLDGLLDSVNGGATRAGGKENPNSEEVPYNSVDSLLSKLLGISPRLAA